MLLHLGPQFEYQGLERTANPQRVHSLVTAISILHYSSKSFSLFFRLCIQPRWHQGASSSSQDLDKIRSKHIPNSLASENPKTFPQFME